RGAGRARAAASPIERRQLRAVLVAYAVGSLGALDALALVGLPYPPTSFIWLTAAAGILAVAIRSHRLLDAPDLGWRALGWLLASISVAVPVVAALALSDGWAGWRQPLVAGAMLHLVLLRPHLRAPPPPP